MRSISRDKRAEEGSGLYGGRVTTEFGVRIRDTGSDSSNCRGTVCPDWIPVDRLSRLAGTGGHFQGGEGMSMQPGGKQKQVGGPSWRRQRKGRDKQADDGSVSRGVGSWVGASRRWMIRFGGWFFFGGGGVVGRNGKNVGWARHTRG